MRPRSIDRVMKPCFRSDDHILPRLAAGKASEVMVSWYEKWRLCLAKIKCTVDETRADKWMRSPNVNFVAHETSHEIMTDHSFDKNKICMFTQDIESSWQLCICDITTVVLLMGCQYGLLLARIHPPCCLGLHLNVPTYLVGTLRSMADCCLHDCVVF